MADGWLEVECHRCKTCASISLNSGGHPRATPIWKLEAALKSRPLRPASGWIVKRIDEPALIPVKGPDGTARQPHPISLSDIATEPV